MAYATVDEYLAFSGRSSASSAEREILEELLDAASLAIDEHCFRSFTAASSATSADRTFEVRAGARALFVDDYVGDATVTIDGSTIDVTPAPVSEGRPRTTLLPDPCFDTSSSAVIVSATWGWPATPATVKLATKLQAAKLDARRQSPSGIERGNDDVGFVRILGVDRDVQELLRPFVRAARTFA